MGIGKILSLPIGDEKKEMPLAGGKGVNNNLDKTT
jgi:hypothetical protein